MKKIQSTHKPSIKKTVFAALLILVLLASTVLVYAYINKKWIFRQAVTPTSSPRIDMNPPSEPQKQAGSSTKDTITQSSSETASQPNNQPSTTVVTITSTNQSNGTLYIRALIDTINPDGTCELVMKSSTGKTYTTAARTQTLANNSTCQGFNVPISSLSAEKWVITLNYKDAATTGTTTQEIVIQ